MRRLRPITGSAQLPCLRIAVGATEEEVSPDGILSEFPISCLYHFTDVRNLPSIRQHGLLPLAELVRRAIECVAPGGNEWSHTADERLGLHEYVHLCFVREHPMEYQARVDGRVGETVFLEIDPIVLDWDGVRFTSEVSNKKGARLLEVSAVRENLDLDILYNRRDWKRDKGAHARWMAARKHEVLVPRPIDASFLRNLR